MRAEGLWMKTPKPTSLLVAARESGLRAASEYQFISAIKTTGAW